MTHDTKYVDNLPSTEQIKKEFVTAKGNGSHITTIEYDCGSSGTIHGSPGALPPDEGQVLRPFGQGTCMHESTYYSKINYCYLPVIMK